MYSTLTTAPKHAVVAISEMLAAHGPQYATVKPSYEPNPSSNTVTLVFNIDEGPKAQSRGIVLKHAHQRCVPHGNPDGSGVNIYELTGGTPG